MMMQQIKVNGAWVEVSEDNPLEVGAWYRQQVGTLRNGSPIWEEKRNIEVVAPEAFTTANESVTINGNGVAGFQSVYFGKNGDAAVMSFDLVDDQNVLQTQLDSVSLSYPPILALPVVKIADGTVVDEVYFSTTLVEGVITVNGSFPASGNWKMLTDRINSALAEIGATWVIDKEDVTFRINS